MGRMGQMRVSVAATVRSKVDGLRVEKCITERNEARPAIARSRHKRVRELRCILTGKAIRQMLRQEGDCGF
jgi:hypothetical protein